MLGHNSLEGLVRPISALNSSAPFYKALQEVYVKHSRQAVLHEALYQRLSTVQRQS